jgi:hypothetical protein
VGFAGFAVLAVVAVLVLLFAAVELVVVAAGADAPTSPLLSPGLVTRNVIASTATPSNAMIAGRGSSIREAVGKVGGSNAAVTAFSALRPRCLSAGSVPAPKKPRQNREPLLS